MTSADESMISIYVSRLPKLILTTSEILPETSKKFHSTGSSKQTLLFHLQGPHCKGLEKCDHEARFELSNWCI